MTSFKGNARFPLESGAGARGGLQGKLRAKALGALSNIEAAVDWLEERKAALV